MKKVTLKTRKRIFLIIVAFLLCAIIVGVGYSPEVNIANELDFLIEAVDELSACIELILEGEEVEYSKLDELYTEVYVKYTECRILLEESNDYSLQNYLVNYYRKLDSLYYSLVDMAYINRENIVPLMRDFDDVKESFDLFVSAYEDCLK